MRLSIFASVAILATFVVADTKTDGYSVMLPSVEVEGISEQDNLKGYVAYDSAEVNRNGLSNKQTPQTIETIDIQKKIVTTARTIFQASSKETPASTRATICAARVSNKRL